jgi:hypothetical protein
LISLTGILKGRALVNNLNRRERVGLQINN